MLVSSVRAMFGNLTATALPMLCPSSCCGLTWVVAGCLPLGELYRRLSACQAGTLKAVMPGLVHVDCYVSDAEYVVIPAVVKGLPRTGAGEGRAGGSGVGGGSARGGSSAGGSGARAVAVPPAPRMQVLLESAGFCSNLNAIKSDEALQGWLALESISSDSWPDFLAAVLQGMRVAPTTLLMGQPRARSSLLSVDLLFGCNNALWLLQLHDECFPVHYPDVSRAVVNAQLQAVADNLPPGAAVHMVVFGWRGADSELTRWFTKKGGQVHALLRA